MPATDPVPPDEAPRDRPVAARLAAEPGAWESLVRGRAGLIWAVVRACGFDEGEAAELFHEIWLMAWEQLGLCPVGDEAELDAWLVGRAEHASRSRRDRRARP